MHISCLLIHISCLHKKGGIGMILHNVGYDHRHDSDFFIDRPEGSGDLLLLILRSDALFTLGGKEQFIPKNTFFLFPQGMPQHYRCLPQNGFVNDWMHFLFEEGEEAHFLSLGIPYAEPVPLLHTEFYTYCIKAIADENSSQRQHRADSILHYFWLICNKVSERIAESQNLGGSSRYEMLLTVRNQLFANPYWEWSVDWASHQTRMSRSAFQHHYKAQFGVTFIQDLIAARVEYAQMLLKTTDLSVHDISVQCGYQNYEHFARQFKAQCGIAPGAFRSGK